MKDLPEPPPSASTSDDLTDLAPGVASQPPGVACDVGHPDFALSTLHAAMELGWAKMRQLHPELPAVVLVIAPAARRGPGPGACGWSAMRWVVAGDALTAEVLIPAEGLCDGAPAVMAALLHRGAHALATVRGIKETSRQCRFHNANYRTLCVEVGLDPERGKNGWAETCLSDAAGETYASEVALLADALKAWRLADVVEREPKPVREPYRCRCEPERTLWLTEKNARRGPITCGLCGEPFEAGGEGDEELMGDPADGD